MPQPLRKRSEAVQLSSFRCGDDGSWVHLVRTAPNVSKTIGRSDPDFFCSPEICTCGKRVPGERAVGPRKIDYTFFGPAKIGIFAAFHSALGLRALFRLPND